MTQIGKAVTLGITIWLMLLSNAFAQDVDLELVLAVDGSGSVSEKEFKLQLGGIASAFRSERIQSAIRQGPLQKIAVALVIWSDAAFTKFPTQWHVVGSPQSAESFARTVENFNPRKGITRGQGGGGTGIGAGVAFALDMIAQNGLEGTRRTIDVSGDGIETPPWFGDAVEMPQAKLMARAVGVTINGLAIRSDFTKLDDYYRENVISGPGAFVMEAADFEDFEQAIRRKLYREIVVIIGSDAPETMYRPARLSSNLLYVPTGKISALPRRGDE